MFKAKTSPKCVVINPFGTYKVGEDITVIVGGNNFRGTILDLLPEKKGEDGIKVTGSAPLLVMEGMVHEIILKISSIDGIMRVNRE